MYLIDNKKAAILQVQTLLRDLSYQDERYSHVPKDGIYGTETREAVSLFQVHQHLSVSGEVDYDTFCKLKEQAKKPSSPVTYKRGDSSDSVQKLNEALIIWENRFGEDASLPASTYFSKSTENAVKKLQTCLGWKVDGTMDDRQIQKVVDILEIVKQFD